MGRLIPQCILGDVVDFLFIFHVHTRKDGGEIKRWVGMFLLTVFYKVIC